MKKINFKYLKLWEEIPIFLMLAVLGWFRKYANLEGNGKILIVDSCLVGEFAASLPAVSTFIKNNPDKIVDLMVSPPLKPWAEKMTGVRKVFTVSSSYRQASEKICENNGHFDAYEKIIVLRASKDIYKIVRTIKTAEIKTGLWPFVVYAFHLVKSLIIRKVPRRWNEVSFAMLGYLPRKVAFEDIFSFKDEDYVGVKSLLQAHEGKMKVLIHTGSHWPMNHWPAKNWTKLLNKIHQNYECNFLFIGGIKEDKDDYAYISSHLDFETFSLIDKTSLLESLLLMRFCDYFICIDSGPMNMGHLADIRSINIFGPGPHMFMPENESDIILDKSFGRGLFQRYYKAKNSFISKITVDEVYEAFISLLPIRK